MLDSCVNLVPPIRDPGLQKARRRNHIPYLSFLCTDRQGERGRERDLSSSTFRQPGSKLLLHPVQSTHSPPERDLTFDTDDLVGLPLSLVHLLSLLMIFFLAS